MSIRHATLHQLRVFNALAQHLNVTRTAEALHLTPPAVSIQVKQLAKVAGQPLLEQVGKQLYLTDAGKTTAAACRDLFERMERLSQDLAMLSGVENGRVRVAIITTAEYLVPELLGRFCAAHPSIEVSLFVGNRNQLLERIKNNEDDLYVLGRVPKGMPIDSEVFADNPLVMAAPPAHPLAGRKTIDPKAIRSEPFILREPGSGTRRAVLDFFEQRKIELTVRMELGSNEAIKQCVIAGLGVAVLSLNNLQQELAGKRVATLNVKGFPLKRHWHVVSLRDKILSPTARAFREFLMSERLDIVRRRPSR